MKVKIRRVMKKEDEQVVIECVEITREIQDIYSYALTKGTELSGMEEGVLRRFKLEDVYYFEAIPSGISNETSFWFSPTDTSLLSTSVLGVLSLIEVDTSS